MRRAILFLTVSVAAWAQELALVQVASGFDRVTDIQFPGDGTGRMFVVEQRGTIRIVRDGRTLAAPFLDIVPLVTRIGGIGDERGLLGLAFPPDFAQKQHFYVNYTAANGATNIVRYRVSASNPDVADAGSAQVLLTVSQPFSNHNGGQLAFGPDGYLYIGLGDGGSARDPQGHGQNRQSLLGKMLRIDTESDASYRVPGSNPFVGDGGYRPEIWALGLRNPWRYSFDRETGDLWIADVGQNRAEEIHFQPASSRGGENYGWNTLEGFQCLLTPSCNPAGLTMPVYEYTSRNAGDVSVTGGYVYRGTRSPSLTGLYLYADYGSGRIWALRKQGDQFVNTELRGRGFPVSTFGQDAAGEIYAADYRGGVIYRIESARRPAFTANGVVNAASFAPGMAAGSLATVFASAVKDSDGITLAPRVPLPESLEDVSVTVGGRAAPIHSIARVGGREQINFQVPFELAGQQSAAVVVRRGLLASDSAEVALLAVQPGVFRSDARPVVVHNDSHTLVTAERQAVRGGFVYFYAVGLGPVDHAPATGAAGPVSPLARAVAVPQVTLGGVNCEVAFAGMAPDLVGVYQVTIRVPQSLAAGEHDLVVSTGGSGINAGRVPVR
jgi:uncharacterized protein (TIGR03437 family)